eukprot:8294430-Ditylum_brightwellii.AAC.1
MMTAFSKQNCRFHLFDINDGDYNLLYCTMHKNKQRWERSAMYDAEMENVLSCQEKGGGASTAIKEKANLNVQEDCDVAN